MKLKPASLVHHQNVALLYEANFETEIWFYAMEYVEGKTIGKLLESVNEFSPNEIINIMQQIISGLAHAWDRHSIIHRDIYPTEYHEV